MLSLELPVLLVLPIIDTKFPVSHSSKLKVVMKEMELQMDGEIHGLLVLMIPDKMTLSWTGWEIQRNQILQLDITIEWDNGVLVPGQWTSHGTDQWITLHGTIKSMMVLTIMKSSISKQENKKPLSEEDYSTIKINEIFKKFETIGLKLNLSILSS